MTFALLLSLAIYDPWLLMPAGLVMFLVARVWLTLLTLRESSPQAAVMTLFVPFMPTLFLLNRFDVAWLPFCYGISGLFMAICVNAGLR